MLILIVITCSTIILCASNISGKIQLTVLAQWGQWGEGRGLPFYCIPLCNVGVFFIISLPYPLLKKLVLKKLKIKTVMLMRKGGKVFYAFSWITCT